MSHHKKPLLEVWLREWRRITLKWPFLFVTIVGPLIAFFLLAWIFEEGTPRKLPVAVVDCDKTSLSRQITRFVDATPIAAVDKSYVSLNEAKLAMEKGKADAVIFIPENTEKKILTGQGTDVELFVNNENVVKGGLISAGVRKAIGTLSAGIKLRTQLQKGITQDQALARVQPVQLRSNVMFNPYISYPYYITAGFMPALLMVFCLLGTIYSFGTELFKGSGIKLINSAGGDMRVAIIGKLLPYTLIYFCMAMVINVFVFVFQGTPLNGNVFIILFSQLLLVIAYQFMGLFLIGLLGNMRFAMSLGSAYSMLALTYCGLTFPYMAMPSIAKAFSLIFPYTYWVRIFVGQSLRFEPASNAMHYLMAMVCFIFLGLTMIPRYKYLLVTKKEWGKE
jgi:ABC-2 type transport system permease protein